MVRFFDVRIRKRRSQHHDDELLQMRVTADVTKDFQAPDIRKVQVEQSETWQRVPLTIGKLVLSVKVGKRFPAIPRYMDLRLNSGNLNARCMRNTSFSSSSTRRIVFILIWVF